MNGGSLIRVTSRPLTVAAATATSDTDEQRDHTGDAVVASQLRHHQRRQDHHGADRQVDAGSEDDQRLADGQ